MSRRAFVICLALFLASQSYAIVIAPPWDDWTIPGGEPGWSIQIDPPDDTLAIWRDDTGLELTLSNDNMYQYLSYLSQPDARLEVDVSWAEDEWAGTDVWAELSFLAINSNPGYTQLNPDWPPGPHPSLPAGHWEPGYGSGGIYSTTVSFDISSYDWDGVQGAYWLEFDIATNISSTVTDIGAFYFHEIRIVPEPATIAMLGLGALTLLRKKRRRSRNV